MVNRAPQKAFRHGKGSSSFKRFLVSGLCLGGFWSEQVFQLFFAKLQLFAIQVCLFTCLAVIEKGATSFSLSPDWPSCIISASRISARQLGTALAALAIHTSMEILPSSCPFNSFRSRFVGIYALRKVRGSGRVNHMCVKM